MAMEVKFCGRAFKHIGHSWKSPILGVPEARWPMFQCHGINEGITEEEFIRGSNAQEVSTEDLTESSEDALRRFAGILHRLKIFIANPENQVTMKHPRNADVILLVRVDDVQAILTGED